MANKKYIVNHDNQFLSTSKGIQKVPRGTEVTVDEGSAENLVKKGRLVLSSDKKTLDLTKKKEAKAPAKEAKTEVKEA